MPAENSLVIGTLAINVVLGTIFILSIMLCAKRRDMGFKILPVGTGLIFLNSFYFWIGGEFFARLTHFLVFLGFLTIALSLFMMLIARGHDDSNQKDAEQASTGQPATRPESKSEGSDKPQTEAEGRSR
jgi:hypothetical protein